MINLVERGPLGSGAPELEAVLWENPMYGILDGHWKQGYGGSAQTRSWKRLILMTMA
jgi:hypothetical protein